jgi:hypothetical protein
MDAVVEAVFIGEEASRQGRYLAGLLAAGVHQLAHVAAGAKGLGAVAAQQHAGDAGVLGPGVEFRRQGLDHRQGQGVQTLFRIQGGNADAEAMQARAFFEKHVHVGALGSGGLWRSPPGSMGRLSSCATWDRASRGRR